MPDVDEGIRHWLARGVGPFFLERLYGFAAVVRGQRTTLDLAAAFAYSGDQQIEVIEPGGDNPSIYEEFLARHPTGGLQHLAVWVDSIDGKLADLDAAGVRYEVTQRYGDGHAYLDLTESPGVMIQLMAHNAAIDQLFSIIREAARDWDGVSDPVRGIDWSTGQAVVTPI